MKLLVIDYETTKSPRLYPWHGAYVVMAAAVGGDGREWSWLINHPDATKLPRQSLDELQSVIDEYDLVIAQNLKFEYIWCNHLGVRLDHKRVFCTMVAEFLIRGQDGSYRLGLDVITKRYGLPGKIDLVKQFWESGYETDEIPANTLVPYCLQDCRATLAVFLEQMHWINRLRLNSLVSLKMEEIPILAEMESHGMLIDRVGLEAYGHQLEVELGEIEQELRRLVKLDDFNPGSGEHISAVLFGGIYKADKKEPRELKGIVSPPRGSALAKKKGYFKTDADTLQKVITKTKEEARVIELLLEHSKKSTQLGTFVEGIISKLDQENKIHPQVHQTRARTGRWSSSDPNGQNIPRGNTSPVKKVFVSRFT